MHEESDSKEKEETEVSKPAVEENERSSSPKKSPAWPIAVAAIFIVGFLIAGYLFKRSFDTADEVTTWPAKAATSLSRLFNTDVTVSSNSLNIGDDTIAELALVERQMLTTTKYETSFLGSKATVIIKGNYTVKAGYDMNKDYALTYDETGKVIHADLPDPEILSVQTNKQEVYYLDESLLNRIDSEDWEDAFAANRQAAELEARHFGILQEAQKRFYERGMDILAPQGIELAPLIESKSEPPPKL